ncbi:unnamed protein product [Calypogeia fissa]
MTHACYLLRSLNPRFKSSFYIGCTTDPKRRLRQHNGEMAQGAHFTKKKRPWEMVLCVYGFTSHVNALQFEWAWQHPLVSLPVREAAAKLPSLKGVPGMIKLVSTMVTLPKWNSLNLTLQFMLSSLLQHRHGSPPLPPQMRLFVAPIQSLPGKDSGDDNDDNDDLSNCPDDLSQSVQLDEDGYLNASSSAADAQLRVTEVGSTAELADDITSSPCPKPKGKKSRKGKTPQGMKGKRGGNKKLSEDPILIDLQIKGSGSRACFGGEELGAVEQYELNDCGVFGDSTIETLFISSVNQGESMDCYGKVVDLSYLPDGEKLALYLDSEDDLQRSLEIDFSVSGTSNRKVTADTTSHSGSQERRASSDEDLTNSRSIGERIRLHETSKVDFSWLENRPSVMESNTGETTLGSQSSQEQRFDSYAFSEDLSCWSVEETILSEGFMKDQNSERPIAGEGSSLSASRIPAVAAQVECIDSGEGEKIGSRGEEHNISKCLEERRDIENCYGVSQEDLSRKSIGERILADGPLEDESQTSFVHSSLVRDADSGSKSANHESDEGDSDIEEISVEEFRTAGGRTKALAVPSTRSTEGDGRCVPSSIADTVQTSLTDVEPLRKSTKTLFPDRKQGAVPTSIYRKSRNGEICKVLEDHSNTRNAPNAVESEGKRSGILTDSKSSSCRDRIQGAALIIDSDDDEIQEISVTEFKQRTFVGKGLAGRMERVCSLSTFR